jgi:hypothetical protein
LAATAVAAHHLLLQEPQFLVLAVAVVAFVPVHAALGRLGAATVV